MKNVFELLANNLFLRREPKWILRCDLGFRNTHADMQDIVERELKKNKSYFSLLIGDCEMFLGEVNYDISSIPVGEFYLFEQYFTYRMTEQLRKFVEDGDKELVKKLHDHLKDGEYLLRYIVKDCIDGTCLTFVCELRWRGYDSLFALKTCYCGYEAYSPDWLEYWYDRKRYFAC